MYWTPSYMRFHVLKLFSFPLQQKEVDAVFSGHILSIKIVHKQKYVFECIRMAP